jgi:K+-transporting ATPase A subunit
MILLIYEILLFLIISFSYFFIQTIFGEIHFGILASIFGMFTTNLFMCDMLLYKSPEYNDKKIFKIFINLINLVIIIISLIILNLLTVK